MQSTMLCVPALLLRPADRIGRTVRSLAKGEGYISPAVSGAVLADYRQHVTDPIDLLTSREREGTRICLNFKVAGGRR